MASYEDKDNKKLAVAYSRLYSEIGLKAPRKTEINFFHNGLYHKFLHANQKPCRLTQCDRADLKTASKKIHRIYLEI